MTARLGILAEERDGELAGLSGTYDWGQVMPIGPDRQPSATPTTFDAFVVLRCEDADVSGARRVVRWLAGSPGADARAGHQKLIAPGGEGLWSRAPWPVNDQLFALPGAKAADGALVAGSVAADREAVAAKLVERGIAAVTAPQLTLAALAAAAVVVLMPENVPLGDATMLPAPAPAVIAAGRLLVTSPAEHDFGLQAGFERQVGTTTDQLVAHVESGFLHWEAFEAARALGRLAAERHRASMVYGELLYDLLLEASYDAGDPAPA